MAQLNPNFEIDFNDINSYEQIQLINDTRLAKENLLMHRAYKEPSDDAIIRNQFSSFTFVDFCPKLFTLRPSSSASGAGPSSSPSFMSSYNNNNNNNNNNHLGHQSSAVMSGAGSPSSRRGSSATIRHYELETFSDLFERINVWLKLNKDWRVVSMETLVFDCTSQFNHLKSSIHTVHLPRNTRGLRLFLSPSKSRFSGPQKIGCINVVPRKVSGSHGRADEPAKYETLDQILARLNELLLTRPIEGRILSVETITLPMVNGYVNTETNYFMDNRLNLLSQDIHSLDGVAIVRSRRQSNTQQLSNHHSSPISHADQHLQSKPMVGPSGAGSHTLIDILRVYYEFGPMVCGLVNLIDFVPRFYSPTTATSAPPAGADHATGGAAQQHEQPADEQLALSSSPSSSTSAGQPQPQQQDAPDAKPIYQNPKITATESLTRLVRRSLSWFEAERKRVLLETGATLADDESDEPVAADSPTGAPASRLPVDLKVCNLQVHHKTMLKNELIQVNSANALDKILTRLMSHERLVNGGQGVDCDQCSLTTDSCPSNEWCSHLIDLCQPYDLKFIRLAYVIPVHNAHQVRPICPMRPMRSRSRRDQAADQDRRQAEELLDSSSTSSSSSSSDSISSSSSSSSDPSSEDSSSAEPGHNSQGTSRSAGSADSPSGLRDPTGTGELAPEHSGSHNSAEEIAKESGEQPKSELDLQTEDSTDDDCKWSALDIINKTNELHRQSELAHQLQLDVHEFNDAPIGQLTYRLFAPCQLVNSSSCFSINPVNSSNPLARRGSVDINGAGLSSENAHPSSLLLPTSGADHHQPQIISFGAFFPALSHDIFPDSQTLSSSSHSSKQSSANSRFTTNEFESVEAIRRRMEVYVTTNSMKVIAGETLIVNLSDALSCLSTAIEQTVVKSPFAQRAPSTWVSVYILYSAVDKPQLPVELLEQYKLRGRLGKINEHDEDQEGNPNEGLESSDVSQSNMEPVFDDDFKPLEDLKQAQQESKLARESGGQSNTNKSGTSINDHVTSTNPCEEGTIRIERNPGDSSLTLYNSAYDRTVALPTQPDNHLSHYLEPNEILGSQSECLWFDENDLIDAQHSQYLSSHTLSMSKSTRKSGHKKSKKGFKSRRGRQEDSQCSIM